MEDKDIEKNKGVLESIEKLDTKYPDGFSVYVCDVENKKTAQQVFVSGVQCLNGGSVDVRKGDPLGNDRPFVVRDVDPEKVMLEAYNRIGDNIVDLFWAIDTVSSMPEGFSYGKTVMLAAFEKDPKTGEIVGIDEMKADKCIGPQYFFGAVTENGYMENPYYAFPKEDEVLSDDLGQQN